MSVAPSRVQPFFYNTPGGAEIDLVLEFAPNKKWAIEIKKGSSPYVSKGFHIACDDIRPQRKYVIYNGRDSFSLGKGITAISLPEMMLAVLGQH